MRRPILATAACIVVAMLTGTSWVPLQLGEQFVEPASAEKLEALRGYIEHFRRNDPEGYRAEGEIYEEQLRLAEGRWEPGWEDGPLEYNWIWTAGVIDSSKPLGDGLEWVTTPYSDPAYHAPHGPNGHQRSRRVRWPYVLPVQALILLLGGGLLSLVVRRERRKTAASSVEA